jgi:hypothetical protein
MNPRQGTPPRYASTVSTGVVKRRFGDAPDQATERTHRPGTPSRVRDAVARAARRASRRGSRSSRATAPTSAGAA